MNSKLDQSQRYDIYTYYVLSFDCKLPIIHKGRSVYADGLHQTKPFFPPTSNKTFFPSFSEMLSWTEILSRDDGEVGDNRQLIRAFTGKGSGHLVMA